jgi:hypothetical protein
VKIANIEIVPTLSLDPELLGRGAGEEAIFRDVIGPTTLAQAMGLGTFRLYRARDIMQEIPAVSEFLFRISNSGRDNLSLLGGYAFLDQGRFLFGGEQAFTLHKEWERAFERIRHTSPVEVAIDGRKYKLIVRGSDLALCERSSEIVIPFAAFLQSAAAAISENQAFRCTLKSELRSRFGQIPCDLANQLE